MLAICFALGSIVGPVVGGVFIDIFETGSIFYSISGMLLIVFVAGIIFKQADEVKSVKVETHKAV